MSIIADVLLGQPRVYFISGQFAIQFNPASRELFISVASYADIMSFLERSSDLSMISLDHATFIWCINPPWRTEIDTTITGRYPNARQMSLHYTDVACEIGDSAPDGLLQHLEIMGVVGVEGVDTHTFTSPLLVRSTQQAADTRADEIFAAIRDAPNLPRLHSVAIKKRLRNYVRSTLGRHIDAASLDELLSMLREYHAA
jgi:hypothetical protein